MVNFYHTFARIVKLGIFLAILFYFGNTVSMAQTKPSVSIEGEVQRKLTLESSDFLKMKRAKATLIDREGTSHVYEGVPVTDILDTAGVTLGRQLRGENLSKYLLVKCADGYQVLFSLAELDSSFTERVVILADQMDGRPIQDGRGPFRLIVPGEKAPARSSFEVTTFIVGIAKD